MFTIDELIQQIDRRKNEREMTQDLIKEESNNSEQSFIMGLQSSKLPSKLAREADINRRNISIAI